MSIWQYAKEAAKIVAKWPKERQTTLDFVEQAKTSIFNKMTTEEIQDLLERSEED